MAKANYWQKGDSIDYANTATAAIEANTIVVIGSHIGIAGGEIPAGAVGTLFLEGVFRLPKGETEISLGDTLYFDAESGTVTATKAEKLFAVGYAVEAAAAAQAEVLTKLHG